MMATSMMSASVQRPDAELVAQSRAGSQHAFGEIVARYQSLICSLAYSATGSLSQSEDVAQQTFITAWKQMHTLREPERLRAWLCGIARNLSSHTVRTLRREPTHASVPLEVVDAAPSADLVPSEQAISREEEGILWRSLERIPMLYREPLVLFYREHGSVQEVANALELSPDAVKQRLARGRKMLHQEVVAFVEGALRRTTPGKAFTLGVLAALQVFVAGSAAAATVGTAGAKITAAAKLTIGAGMLGSMLGPIIGFLGGAFGSWMSIKNTRSPRERQFMIRQSWITDVWLLLFSAVVIGFVVLGRPLTASHPATFGFALALLFAGFFAGMFIWILRSNRRQRQIRIEDGTADIPVPAEVPTRIQQLWTVYGCLGGSTLGVLAWIVVQAAHAEEWITVIATVLFGAAVVLINGHVWMRGPQRGVLVSVSSLALLGMFTVAVAVVHWRDWTKAAGVQVTAMQALLIGSVLALPSLVVGVFAWFRRNRLPQD